MRTLWSGLVVLGLAATAAGGLAAEPKDEERSSDAGAEKQKRQSEARAYLGVLVEPLHPSLFGHLADLLRGGEGVRVYEVTEDSPADDAGLRHNDIILRYDDQRIFSPEQLAKLVSLDKPGREVELTVIRSGKSKQIRVTLGERRDEAAARRALRPPLADDRPRSAPRAEEPSQWESFDSLTLSRIDDKHFKATVRYRNKQGKLATHTFEGTREELIRDIKAEDDLPANERMHLLRALGMVNHASPLALPELWVLPDGSVILEAPELESSDETEEESEREPQPEPSRSNSVF